MEEPDVKLIIVKPEIIDITSDDASDNTMDTNEIGVQVKKETVPENGIKIKLEPGSVIKSELPEATSEPATPIVQPDIAPKTEPIDSSNNVETSKQPDITPKTEPTGSKDTATCKPAENNSTETAQAIEDDVPMDFFDDFDNKDFLAGLDVVDTWENDDTLSEDDSYVPNSTKNKKTVAEIHPQASEKENTVYINSKAVKEPEESQTGKSCSSKTNSKETQLKGAPKSRTSKDKRNKANDTERESRNKEKSSNRDRSRREERESEKRGRDRETLTAERRDPEKVKRDIQRDKERCEKERISAKLKMVETGLLPPGTEMDAPDTSQPTQSVETQKVSKESTIERRTSSSRKRSYTRSPSPYHRKRRYSRSHSPYYSKHHSPSYRRRSRTRSRSRSRSRSHYDRRKRNRSRSSSRRHGRSPSERRSSKRNRNYSPEARKQSFLEELQGKLNTKHAGEILESIKAQLNGVKPASTPTMVPPPAPFVGPVFDQQFFIGDHSSFAQGMHTYNNSANMYSQMPTTSFDSANTAQNQTYYPQTCHTTAANQQELAKLFNDDNISFTEFLRLTHQPNDIWPQTELIHKPKVLNRCQDAIRFMSEMTQYNGRFFCKVNKQTAIVERPDAGRHQTPMKTHAAIRFVSTTKKTVEPVTTPGMAISKLIAKLGIREKKPVSRPSSAENGYRQEDGSEANKCNECEVRKNKIMVDVGVQCNVETTSFGCQVSHEDFFSKARSSLQSVLQSQSQSFATMTPALLRGQSEPERVQDMGRGSVDWERRNSDRRLNSYDFERRSDQERSSHDLDYERRSDIDRERAKSRTNTLYMDDTFEYPPRPPLAPPRFKDPVPRRDPRLQPVTYPSDSIHGPYNHATRFPSYYDDSEEAMNSHSYLPPHY